VFVSFKMNELVNTITVTNDTMLVALAVVSQVWFDKLPPDLQKTVLSVSQKIEPQIHQWQIGRLAADREVWMKNKGKFNKLSDAEQAEARKRVADSLQPLFAKDAGLKAFYDKIKAIADKTN